MRWLAWRDFWISFPKWKFNWQWNMIWMMIGKSIKNMVIFFNCLLISWEIANFSINFLFIIFIIFCVFRCCENEQFMILIFSDTMFIMLIMFISKWINKCFVVLCIFTDLASNVRSQSLVMVINTKNYAVNTIN